MEGILDALAKPSRRNLSCSFSLDTDFSFSSCASALVPCVCTDRELSFTLAFYKEDSILKSAFPAFGYSCKFGT